MEVVCVVVNYFHADYRTREEEWWIPDSEFWLILQSVDLDLLCRGICDGHSHDLPFSGDVELLFIQLYCCDLD